MPADLGFYDLRRPETFLEQAQLASASGVDAFAIYVYWFSGRAVMSELLTQLAHGGEAPIDFFFCWANESWTRRWDGGSEEILIEQEHDPAVDVDFIDYVLPYFAHPNYMRISGMPVLVVYRADIMHEPQLVTDEWRRRARHAGVGEIVVLMVESFDNFDAHLYGFDGSVQFPPHRLDMPSRMDLVEGLADDFDGRIYSYEQAAEFAINDILKGDRTSAPRFPGVMCGWDNTPRRGRQATLFVGGTPQAYASWLRRAILASTARREPLGGMVFVNAWNEWAEGAHLEPSTDLGRDLLEVTRSERFSSWGPKATAHLLEQSLLNGETDEAVVKRAIGLLESLERDQQSMIDLWRDRRGAMAVVSMVPGPPPAFSALHLRHARGGVDSVNGRAGACLNVSPDSLVRVIGWALSPLAEDLDSFLLLMQDGQPVARVPLLGRIARPDVEASASEMERMSLDTLRVGFDVTFMPLDATTGSCELAVWSRSRASGLSTLALGSTSIAFASSD